MLQSRSWLSLFGFLLLVAAVAVSGVHFQPGDWYAHLGKPSWTPPNWLFPPVWSVLYLMIAIAGWLIFASGSFMQKLLWSVQLALNGLWSWIFFGMHLIGIGALDILALFCCIAALLVHSWKASVRLRWLLTPYLAWVGYASTLNVAIYFISRDQFP